jgi:hypothetical protein
MSAVNAIAALRTRRGAEFVRFWWLYRSVTAKPPYKAAKAYYVGF